MSDDSVLDVPGYPPEAFEEALNETMRARPEPVIDMVGLRDRALTVSTTLPNSSIAELLNNTDDVQAYILNGTNPYAATEATDQS